MGEKIRGESPTAEQSQPNDGLLLNQLLHSHEMY